MFLKFSVTYVQKGATVLHTMCLMSSYLFMLLNCSFIYLFISNSVCKLDTPKLLRFSSSLGSALIDAESPKTLSLPPTAQQWIHPLTSVAGKHADTDQVSLGSPW